MKKVDASRLNQEELSKDLDMILKDCNLMGWVILADKHNKFGLMSYSFNCGNEKDVQTFRNSVVSQIYNLITCKSPVLTSNNLFPIITVSICRGILKGFSQMPVVPKSYVKSLKSAVKELQKIQDEKMIKLMHIIDPKNDKYAMESIIDPLNKIFEKHELVGCSFIYIPSDDDPNMNLPFTHTFFGGKCIRYVSEWVECCMIDSLNNMTSGMLDADPMGALVFDITNAAIKAMLDLNLIDMEFINYICKCHPFNLTKPI